MSLANFAALAHRKFYKNFHIHASRISKVIFMDGSAGSGIT
jgi:hypothetical protein